MKRTRQQHLSMATSLCGVCLLVAGLAAPPALAVPRPTYDPSLVPHDGKPEPAQPMKQTKSCLDLIALPEPDVAKHAPAFDMLNIAAVWQYSTGNGVPVAVIDTGTTPVPGRLPVVPGGDYVTGGDGLSDCDAHGTIVASAIAARPAGVAPRPMPATPAFPPLPIAPVTSVPAPQLGPVPEKPPPPPPPPATVTVVQPPPPPPPDVGPSWGHGLGSASGPFGSPPAEPPPPPPPEPAPPTVGDGVMGVAPDATIIAIRQSSRAFEPVKSSNSGAKAGTTDSLAAAIVHAADLGAKVINISVTACVAAESVGQQGPLAAAIWYAATQKDAVIVTAAGNVTDSSDIGGEKCRQNPLFDPLDTSGDVRDWHQVQTVSLPAWFSDYVLSVGAVDANGVAINKSLAGPWVGVAAPGVGVTGLSPQNGKPVNAIPQINEQPPEALWGTSFSAAYVSGVAALVRAKYPQLSAHQIIERIIRTAHNPPGGVDDAVGYGVVDPVAALTNHIDLSADRAASVPHERLLVPAPPLPPADTRARNIALGAAGVVVAAVALAWGVGAARRRRHV